MSWLRKDVGLKLVSLLISVVLWAYVKSITLANTTRTIEFKLFPTGLDQTAYSIKMPPSVKIMAEGTLEAIQRLDRFKANEFVASVDLSNATSGFAQYRVALQRDESRDYGITYAKPDRVMVGIQPMETTTPKTVQPQPVTLPDGYFLSTWEITPPSVTLTGPHSELNKVSQIVVQPDLRDYLKHPGETYQLDVVLLDSANRRVETVRADPSKVMLVPVLAQLTGVKNVTILPNWTGNLPFGYRVDRYFTNPQQVKIEGDANALRKYQQVQTEPVNLSGIIGRRRLTVRLVRPEKVKAMTPRSVQVTVDVGPAALPKSIPQPPISDTPQADSREQTPSMSAR